MEKQYNPRYLKPEPPQGQDAADLEVFGLVKNNPSRKVNAEALPPVVLEMDGTMHFMIPPRRDTVGGLGLVAIATAVLAAGIGAACAYFTGDFVPLTMVSGVIAAGAFCGFVSLRGEREEWHRK